MYLGLRQNRVRGAEYDAFIDEFVQAVQEMFPKIRSPSVTTMKRTSFCGQLASSSFTRPFAVTGRYMPRLARKI